MDALGALEPDSSDRHYYRDPFSGIKREIWRPGDGDGDPCTDYEGYEGAPLPVEKRWRLFQLNIGRIARKNMPPKLVLLDDCAAAEVYNSDIPRIKLSEFWPHDFGSPGRVRARRSHRGRPAIKDPIAEGDEKFHSAPLGANRVFYFTGEKDYKPILYGSLPSLVAMVLAQEQKRKRPASQGSEAAQDHYDHRSHGHNQYTPRDMMVKYGASSLSHKEPKQKRAKSSFLRPALRRILALSPTSRIEASELRTTDMQATAIPIKLHSTCRLETSECATLEKGQLHALEAAAAQRNGGYVEQFARKQDSANVAINPIRGDETVVTMADELARARTNIEVQANELAALRQTHLHNQEDIRAHEKLVRRLNAAKVEADNQIEMSERKVAILEAKVAQLEEELSALRQEIESIPD